MAARRSGRSGRTAGRRASGAPGPALPTGPVQTSTGLVELVPDRDEPRLVTLLLDGVPSSALHLDHPERLDFEYMQQMAAALALLRPGPLRVVHLGAAGCALARHVEAVRPGSHQLAVDLDALLLERAREWFALPRAPRLRLRAGDARQVLAGLPSASADVVVRDAFAGGATPAHLTTVEFHEDVARVLRPGGLYLANVADRPPLASARAEVGAVLATAVAGNGAALLAEPGVLRGRRYGNLVLVAQRTGAGDQEADGVDLGSLARTARTLPVPVRVLTGAELEAFVGTARPPRDAPVADAGPATHRSPRADPARD